jgi:hypothetical protein
MEVGGKIGVFQPGTPWIAALNPVFVYVVYLRVYGDASGAVWML